MEEGRGGDRHGPHESTPAHLEQLGAVSVAPEARHVEGRVCIVCRMVLGKWGKVRSTRERRWINTIQLNTIHATAMQQTYTHTYRERET